MQDEDPPWDEEFCALHAPKSSKAAPTTEAPQAPFSVDFSKGKFQGEILTIYTDASYCPNTGAAGWGAWMRDSNKTHACGGSWLPGVLDCSNKAEVYGIIAAIKEVHAMNWLTNISLVVIVTDSQYAQGIINGSLTRNRPMNTLVNDALDLLRVNSCRWKVNWVKGHSNQDGARSWVNQQCDRIARKHMEHARKLCQ